MPKIGEVTKVEPNRGGSSTFLTEKGLVLQGVYSEYLAPLPKRVTDLKEIKKLLETVRPTDKKAMIDFILANTRSNSVGQRGYWFLIPKKIGSRELNVGFAFDPPGEKWQALMVLLNGEAYDVGITEYDRGRTGDKPSDGTIGGSKQNRNTNSRHKGTDKPSSTSQREQTVRTSDQPHLAESPVRKPISFGGRQK